MKIAIIVLTDILHIFSLIFVCKMYLKLNEREDYKKRLIKTLILISIISVTIINLNNILLELILYFCCVFGVMYINFKEKLLKEIVVSVWTINVIEIIEMITLYANGTVKYFIKSGSLVIDEYTKLEELIASATVFCIVVIVGKILNNISYRGIQGVSVKYIAFFTAVTFADLIMITFMMKVTLVVFENGNKMLYIADFIAVVGVIFIQIIAIILLLASRNVYKEKQEVINQYLEEQVKHYEYLNHREVETKKFRHDIRKHIYLLDRLKKQNKDKEFEEYMAEIIEHVGKLDDFINVGNDIVNAILNKYYYEAKNKNIKFNVSGRFPNVCNVSVFNLCTIFSNLLCNAIEATDKLDGNREIMMNCCFDDKQIMIEIWNYFQTDDKGAGIAEKKNRDSDYHGFGLKNVEDSVNECCGLMDKRIIENRFIVTVLLKN